MIHIRQVLAQLNPCDLDAARTDEVFRAVESGGVTPREKQALEGYLAMYAHRMDPTTQRSWEERLGRLKVGIEPLHNVTPSALNPEDLSAPINVVWMQSFSGDECQPSYVADMVRIGMQEGFKVAVQVPSTENESRVKQRVAEMLGIDPSRLDGTLSLVSTDEFPSVWAEDNGWQTAGDDVRTDIRFKTLPKVSMSTLAAAQKFQSEEGYHRLVPDSFQGAVAQRDEMAAVYSLAKAVDRPVDTMRTYVEGGNVLGGTLPNGESYALVGRDSVIISAFHLEDGRSFNVLEVEATVAKMERDGLLTDKKIDDCQRRLESAGRLDNVLDSQKTKTAREFLAKVELTKKLMAADLCLRPQNLFCIGQAEFHNDMMIRPLGAGEILVNDPYECGSLINVALADPEITPTERSELLRLRTEVRELGQRWQPVMDEIARELERLGFDVIRCPGAMGKYSGYGDDLAEVNFMNAVPFTNARGEAVYITNASHFRCLEKAFAEFIRKKGVDKVYFTGSATVKNHGGAKLASEASFRLQGGLDCREKHGRYVG